MFYILVFVGIAVLLVVVVLIRNGRPRGGGATPKPHGTTGASRTSKGSAQRHERKRRRAQSAHDRRKRH